MPALSPTMEEGKLAKWLVTEGQAIKPGDIIAEIETDKATMEVEAVDEGKVSKLLVAEGTEGVKVNTPIAMLDGEGAPAAKGPHHRPRLRQPRLLRPLRKSAQSPRALRQHRVRQSPKSRPAPKPPARPCARRCAMRWRRRCAATRTCS